MKLNKSREIGLRLLKCEILFVLFLSSLLYSSTYDSCIISLISDPYPPGSITDLVALTGDDLGEIRISKTGDTETWETFTLADVEIKEGTDRVLRLDMGSGLNINYINFVESTTSINNFDLQNNKIKIYPNPAKAENVTIDLAQDAYITTSVYSTDDNRIHLRLTPTMNITLNTDNTATSAKAHR